MFLLGAEDAASVVDTDTANTISAFAVGVAITAITADATIAANGVAFLAKPFADYAYVTVAAVVATDTDDDATGTSDVVAAAAFVATMVLQMLLLLCKLKLI